MAGGCTDESCDGCHASVDVGPVPVSCLLGLPGAAPVPAAAQSMAHLWWGLHRDLGKVSK